MDNRNEAAGADGAGERISIREREEFFSGPAAYPSEHAPTPRTELSSAHAEQPGASAAEQSGGGGGLRPLPAPAPIGEAARKFSDHRDELVIQLMFKTRRMAARLGAAQLGAGVYWCRDCAAAGETPEAMQHTTGCLIAPVLRVLAELEATVADAQPDADEKLPDIADEFFEPWSLDLGRPGSVCDRLGNEVYDCDGATEVMEEERERYARRVRACVNFCAGVPTAKLEDAALLGALDREVARLKGGAPVERPGAVSSHTATTMDTPYDWAAALHCRRCGAHGGEGWSLLSQQSHCNRALADNEYELRRGGWSYIYVHYCAGTGKGGAR